jgi:hypothetical protein
MFGTMLELRLDVTAYMLPGESDQTMLFVSHDKSTLDKSGQCGACPMEKDEQD